nr:uncharacterized protein LOC127347204 [Lolium perenne]
MPIDMVHPGNGLTLNQGTGLEGETNATHGLSPDFRYIIGGLKQKCPQNKRLGLGDLLSGVGGHRGPCAANRYVRAPVRDTAKFSRWVKEQNSDAELDRNWVVLSAQPVIEISGYTIKSSLTRGKSFDMMLCGGIIRALRQMEVDRLVVPLGSTARHYTPVEWASIAMYGATTELVVDAFDPPPSQIRLDDRTLVTLCIFYKFTSLVTFPSLCQ